MEAWLDSGDVVQQWNPDTQSFIKNLPLDGAKFSSGKAFEARIPLKVFGALPYQFGVQAVVWHNFKNLYDVGNAPGPIQQIEEELRTATFELLALYADQIDLVPGDPLPAVMALTDGYIHRRASKDLKPQVVKDGLAMIGQARLASATPFEGQTPLSEMGLEALLLWANRSVITGGYDDVTFYVARNEQFNADSYGFHILGPDTLDQARSIAEAKGFLSTADLRGTVNKMIRWIWSVIKYRRYWFSDIEEFYREYPDDPWVKQVYEESLYERDHNLTDVAVINGVAVNKGLIYAPAFQMKYITDNGLFYGNCVDAASVASAILKAYGVPAFTVSYGPVKDGVYKEYHTLLFYYSTSEGRWMNFERDYHASKILSDPEILTEINLPQIGSYFGYTTWSNGSVSRRYGSRVRPEVLTNAEWLDKIANGYPPEAVEQFILGDAAGKE